ncbi:hypothetical protein THIX_60444 [Thiomonas sp. X19]|nr:hypothetical protein THIX_60444 [Thiomonas sp. X19]
MVFDGAEISCSTFKREARFIGIISRYVDRPNWNPLLSIQSRFAALAGQLVQVQFRRRRIKVKKEQAPQRLDDLSPTL